MSGGSQQQRLYRRARRDGSTMLEAAAASGLGIAEARLLDNEDAKNPPPEEAYALLGHNSQGADMTTLVAPDQLRLFIERIEHLEEEKQGIADDIKDVYAEAKSNGYDVKIMRLVVRDRKLEKHTRDERDALLDCYKDALGMLSGTPLGDYALSAVG